MSSKLESRTGEYTLRLFRRLGQWVIELEFKDRGRGRAVLHTETNRTRAEGVFIYFIDNGPDTVRLAERLIGQDALAGAQEG